MRLLDYFRSTREKHNTAAVAKERLQILVAHDRAEHKKHSFLPKLQKELLEVIRKYFDVSKDAISVHLEKDEKHEILELNIVLPGDDGPEARVDQLARG